MYGGLPGRCAPLSATDFWTCPFVSHRVLWWLICNVLQICVVLRSRWWIMHFSTTPHIVFDNNNIVGRSNLRSSKRQPEINVDTDDWSEHVYGESGKLRTVESPFTDTSVKQTPLHLRTVFLSPKHRPRLSHYLCNQDTSLIRTATQSPQVFAIERLHCTA